jgi:hypothetical protein
MRKRVLAGLGLAAVLAVPAAAADGTGPYTGTVSQGQTASHVYDNNPSNNPCLAITASYTITLHYVPGSDTLTLSAVTQTATGSNGVATLTVTQGICARFSIGVTGTSVASSARYVVTVTRQLLPPLSGTN